MDRALGAKAEAVLGQRGVAGIASVEILTHCLGDPVVDPVAQCIAEVEIFA